MKITNESMYNELSVFGTEVVNPVYCSIADFSGFLSSGRPTNWGFLATDSREDRLYITVHSLMETLAGTGGSYTTIYQMTVEKLKVTKALLLGSYTIDIKYRSDGKKYRHKFTIATKCGTELTEQQSNAHNLVNMLRRWESSL
ncbi:MAG: hypothetical protein IJO99_02880 [Ruminococcus sp.]|nr:hypothetical protein [Ruminococcus sp.]